MKYVLIIVTVMFLSGCSVGLAISQPDKRDVSKIMPGSTIQYAGLVLNTTHSIEKTYDDGSKVYTFFFTQGYSKAVKALRVTGHIVADFFTLCLWEIVATPIELFFDGSEAMVQVKTNKEDIIQEVLYEEQ